MSRKPLPAARTASARFGRRPLSLIGGAVALVLGAAGTDASALTLGRLNVQSALGEPLRAEIEVTEISPSEAEGLKVKIATAAAFQASGVTYNPALADVRVQVQRRADGRHVIRLTGTRSLNEPFVDLLLEADWQSGRVTRDYTLLLDPPSTRQASAAPVEATAPQVGSSGSTRTRRAAPAPAPATVTEAAPQRRQRTTQAPPPAAEAPAAAPSAAAGGTGGGAGQVTVQRGDTAGKIAGAHKPADVSLDQMLVAMLRANPDAFVGGNVNRMRAGAVLELPSAAQAGAVPAAEARRTVVAQSRDFSDYRRRLADNAPQSRVATEDRQASGKLQAKVEDRSATPAAPDKLTISQGNAATRAADEKLAQTRQAKADGDRVAELSRNIEELNKLQAPGGAAAKSSGAAAPAPAGGPTVTVPGAASEAKPATPAPVAAAAAPAPAVAPAAAAPAAAPAPGPARPAAAPAAETTPPAQAGAAAPATPAPQAADTAAAPAAAAPAPAPAATPAPAPAAAKPKVAAPPPPPEPSFLDDLLGNPLVLALGALVVLLLGFLGYRLRGRKKADAGESVFIESRIPKDSFFGASGGESVNTKDRSSSIVSSLSYSPSQLDAGDVDPVAEADVYLAYGRDLQAEEILREALRTTPERIAIHLKLLEIHAKRRDLRAFELLANEVHKLTGGNGTEWARVIELGRDLDPGNPLYRSTAPSEGGEAASAPAAAAVAAGAGAAATAVAAAAIDTPVPVPPPAPVAPPPPFVPSVAPLDFDLDLSAPPAPTPAPAASASLPPLAATTAPVPFQATQREAPQVLPPASAVHSNGNGRAAPLLDGIDFTHTLDTEPARLEPLEEPAENPHSVKLSLARELQALGDTEGARSLVEEVAAESSGDLRVQAQQLLGQLR